MTAQVEGVEGTEGAEGLKSDKGTTMKMMLATFLVAALSAVTVATQTPEATSLAGKLLYPPKELSNRAKLEADLAQAEKDLAAKPNDADAIVWLGRRLGYLWRFQD